jgi:hypothetical protein
VPEICYKAKKFGERKSAIIGIARRFVADYQAQGFKLSLRQLFYKFVSEDLLPNTERSYKNLGVTISEARLAGLLDWDAIEDRLRDKDGQPHWDSPVDIVRGCVDAYHIDKWAEQPNRVEVWVEKEALIEVISRAAWPLDVDYFSCKGYVSQSAMWRAARRLIDYEATGQNTIILHLGDHDPSGVDMTRDIQDRLWLFESDVEVKRIALTMDQINELNPPPNPTKATDSRSSKYVPKYGYECWELDALEPAYLVDLVTNEVEKLRDGNLWDEAVEKEEAERELLKEAAEEIKEKLEEEE